ncbi:hypothetical protein EPN28_02270 [Patescibacteria group bacterium]|nr:MAG: hypothetical protein EPN28_02270 [Patescibacteria group bacterium]
MQISSSLLATAAKLFPAEKELLDMLVNGPLGVALLRLEVVVAQEAQKAAIQNGHHRFGAESAREPETLKAIREFTDIIRALVRMEGGE